MASEADEEHLDLFQEPADFYEPEKEATFASHKLLSGDELNVRLVGHNPLWVSLSRILYRTAACFKHLPATLILNLWMTTEGSRKHQTV